VITNVAGLCGTGTAHFGTIDLGSANYVTANADFTNSKIQWNHNGTLTITLGGNPSPAPLAVTAIITATYTPDSAMTDLGGNTATGTAPHTAGGSTSHF